MKTKTNLFRIVALGCFVASHFAAAQGYTLTATYTNPAPVAGDQFGYALAAVGTNRVLVGAYVADGGAATDAGVAYLFDLSGNRITTYTNPTAAASDYFGRAVAAVGTNRVLIGASSDNTGATHAGAAYLFDLAGTLITTYTNPTPQAADNFGYAVAGVGANRVLIGARSDSTGAYDAGAAYLYDLAGNLLVTITNPTPVMYDEFATSVAAVGEDRLLIGGYGESTPFDGVGAAYLYDLTGKLLTTFTNPTPVASDYFGFAVAAVGTNHVLIGADGDNTGATDAGSAYLFDLAGRLLTTYTNPTPAASDHFGWTVAGMGDDRVLIGTIYEDIGATNAGAAYVFDLAGDLLTTITNPTPANNDYFACAMASVGNQLLIGANWDDTGATNTGAAYLFTLGEVAPTAPRLSIILNPQLSSMTVTWPSFANGWVLERTNALGGVSAQWPQVSPPYQTNGETISVSFTNSPAVGKQFFRLRKP